MSYGRELSHRKKVFIKSRAVKLAGTDSIATRGIENAT